MISKLIPVVAYDDDGNKDTDLDIATSCSIVKDLENCRQTYPDIFDLATELERLPSSSSIHAAGIVISPTNLRKTIPIVRSTNPDILATSLDLDSAEKLLVKFDLLALSTLDIIDETEKKIGITFDYENNNFSDPKVWQLINSKTTAGIFQISSPIYKQRMWRLKPRTIQELAACLALIRGPCISSGTDEKYMLIREGRSKVKKVHPIYDWVTRDTNGILIYQEQVMQIAVYFGMSLSEGYRIVKSSAKKKLEELRQYRDKFISLAIKRDCSLEVANQVFDLIEKSSQYSFNRSHM